MAECAENNFVTRFEGVGGRAPGKLRRNRDAPVRHGLDGTEIPDFVPSLRELAGLLDKKGGRAYLARVPGVAQAPLPDRCRCASHASHGPESRRQPWFRFLRYTPLAHANFPLVFRP